MVTSSDAIDIRAVPAGTGFLIFAFSKEGHEIGSAMLEIAHPQFFQNGHGYFIEGGFPNEEGYIAVVSSLDVCGSWAGKGIGRAILRRAEAIAARIDCEWIYVHPSDIGRGDPAGFYRACGFETSTSGVSCLSKRICAGSPAMAAFTSTLDLFGQVILSPWRIWVKQCSVLAEESTSFGNRAFRTFLGA